MFNIEFNWKECSSGKHIVGIHVDWIRPKMFGEQHGLETQHRLTLYVKNIELQKKLLQLCLFLMETSHGSIIGNITL